MSALRVAQGGALLPSEVEAWCRMTGRTLSGWEFETLMHLDLARRRTEGEVYKNTDPDPILGDLTPEAFDFIFG